MLKKFLFSILILIVILSVLITTTCYASSVPVTDENLNTVLQKIASSSVLDGKECKISAKNNIITINLEGKEYTVDYDLTDKPTFTTTIPITEGMSYDAYEKQMQKIILPMIGFIAIANIQGVSIEDSCSYFLLTYMGNAFDSSDSYTIIDDTKLDENATIEKSDDPKVIYASEFGDKVMEYVNSVYKDKQVITDSEDMNFYEWSVERTDVKDDSCNLVSTVSINLNANFKGLEGYAEKAGNIFGDDDNDTSKDSSKDSAKDNNSVVNNNSKNSNSVNNIKDTSSQNSNADNTISAKTLPRTGINGIIFAIVCIGIISIIIYRNKLKEYKDI